MIFVIAAPVLSSYFAVGVGADTKKEPGSQGDFSHKKEKRTRLLMRKRYL